MTHTSHGESPPGWIEGLRVIYDHELLLFRRGNARMRIADQKFNLAPGSFFIVPPGQWHVTTNAGPVPLYRYWCHFDWVYQGSIGDTPVMTFHPGVPSPKRYRRAPRFVPPGILHGVIQRPAVVYELHEQLAVLARRGGHDLLAARGVLLRLLIELFDRRVAGPEPQQVDLASRIRQLLDERFIPSDSPPRMTELLASLGCRYEHACRVFRKEYGIAPLAYVKTQRLSRAKLLLRDTDLPVAVIARRVGFRDPTYFTALFRKTIGRSPTAYREQSPAQDFV